MNNDCAPLPFDAAFCVELRRLFAWRRDVRRFRSEPLPDGALEALLDLATFAPSVGLSQPWRFVIVEQTARRNAVLANFTTSNAEALTSYTGSRARAYAALKLAGLQSAPVHLAAFADRATPLGHGLGRRSMPEMAEYSVVAAIYTIWLAARAAGIGMGWVSILDPAPMNAVLDVPADWRFIGYFCLGFPEREDNEPELQRAGWERRQSAATAILRR